MDVGGGRRRNKRQIPLKLDNVKIKNENPFLCSTSVQQLHGLNHASCKSSLAVGLSLGSNFIIFAMKSLSGCASSSSSDIENGSHFWFSCI